MLDTSPSASERRKEGEEGGNVADRSCLRLPRRACGYCKNGHVPIGRSVKKKIDPEIIAPLLLVLPPFASPPLFGRNSKVATAGSVDTTIDAAGI